MESAASANTRLQPTQIRLGTSISDTGRLRLDYTYGTTNNNGNVRSQRIVIQGQLDLTQSYEYDYLNRISTAEEVSGATSIWKQVYGYDRFGNRRFEGGTTTPDLLNNPQKMVNPTIDEATNRIVEHQDNDGLKDYEYDAAGNLLCDPQHPCGTGQQSTPYYRYDGEGKMTRAGGSVQSGGSEYEYDGNGRRVRKAWGVEVTVFVYNTMGQMVAEYSNVQPLSSGIKYLTQDHMGSTRVVTDQDGQLISRHDYFPFGEEIGAGVGGRTQGQGYSQFDGVRQKFTGYERDNETGLNFAQARYYASAQGRFTSPDPIYFQAKYRTKV